jgi:hypothetical protein
MGIYTYKDYLCSKKDFENLTSFISMQGYKRHIFEFFGGEPTLHPLLNDFCYIVNENLNKLEYIHLMTNLKKPLTYYSMPWPKKLKVSCSYHSHWITDDEKWFEKVFSLHERGMIYNVKFLMTSGNEKEVLRIYKKYRDNTFPIYEIGLDLMLKGSKWEKDWKNKIPNPLYYGVEDNNPNDVYNNGEILYDDETTDDLKNYKKYECFYKMVCNCRFRVANNGDVYYCWMGCWDKDTKPILNAFKDTHKKIPEWHICPFKGCWGIDIPYPKYSIKYFSKNKIKERNLP